MLIIVRNDDLQMLLSCDNCTGNSRFSGFAIDLLTAISKVGQVFFNSDIIVIVVVDDNGATISKVGQVVLIVILLLLFLMLMMIMVLPSARWAKLF